MILGICLVSQTNLQCLPGKLSPVGTGSMRGPRTLPASAVTPAASGINIPSHVAPDSNPLDPPPPSGLDWIPDLSSSMCTVPRTAWYSAGTYIEESLHQDYKH